MRETNCPAVRGCIAIVRHQGKVLLVRRKLPPDDGLWGLPGGKLHDDENAFEGAVRETLEETGIYVTALKAFPEFEEVSHASDGSRTFRYRLTPVECFYVSGRATAGDDAVEAKWFSYVSATDLPVDAVKNLPEVLARCRSD